MTASPFHVTITSVTCILLYYHSTMGLCKCPKRRVTNLFCFVHRVNVCEDCMVTQHPRCVVQSYLKWLEDSDYDPICVLCSKSIQEGEVVRLACYDLFHQSCLDGYVQSFPPHTALAGFSCPKCKEGLFPPTNMVSPVVDKLRQALGSFSWAREGLGLQNAFSDETNELKPSSGRDSPDFDFPSLVTSTPRVNHSSATSSTDLTASPLAPSHPPTHTPHISLQMYEHPVNRGVGGGGPHPHRVVNSGEEDGRRRISMDSDENKYRRKNPMEMLSRWFKHHQRWNLTMDESTVLMRRYLVLVFLAMFAMVTLIVLMTRVGRDAAERDPSLDWRANPNVRTGD